MLMKKRSMKLVEMFLLLIVTGNILHHLQICFSDNFIAEVLHQLNG
jgi:hypothetical protein